jgi:hypothetical protein
MRYRQLGKTVFFNLKVTITTVGTGSGGVVSTLPFTSDTTIARQMSCGRADALSGKMLQARALGTTLQILAYDNTFPAASGEVLYVSGVYESV